MFWTTGRRSLLPIMASTGAQLMTWGPVVRLVAAGLGVELDEIRSLSDRILVMFDGHIVGEADPATATEADLGLMMAGMTGTRNAS